MIKKSGIFLFAGSVLAMIVFGFVRGLPRAEGPELWEKAVMVLLLIVFYAGIILLGCENVADNKKGDRT